MRMGGSVRYFVKAIMAALLILSAASGWAGEDEQRVKINLAGLDLATVAKQAERVTKRSFLFDENVLRAKRVTLQSDTAITPAEFYRVFQAVCQMNGLAIIPVEGAGINLEKIVNAQGAAKEPGAQPVLIRGEQLPGGDATVSYLAKLQHVNATRIMTVLTPALSATGTIMQVPNTELLMINDVASSVKRVEKLLALLDVPGEATTTVTVPVVNLSVEKAHSQLNDYLQAASKIRNGEATKDKIAILKDERLNQMVLIGPPAEVRQAQEFLGLIDRDAPAARRTIRYYKLKNVPVKDIVDYVGQLLGVALMARGDPIPPQGGPVPVVPVAPSAGGPVVPAVPVVPVGALKSPSAPATAAKPTTKDFVPADIIPVEGLNTLVVAGDAAVHQEVEAILANLDKRKGQVLIEVAIVQVTGDDSIDLGVEGLGLNEVNGDRKLLDYGSGFGLSKQSDTKGRGFPTEAVLDHISGGAFRFVKDDKLQIVLSAIANKSNVSIVSQPQLLVNDNEEASFTTKVSEPTSTSSVTAGNPIISTFSGFADATTSLKITPHISPDNYLNLEIVQTFEEFTGVSSGNGVPPPKVSNNATTKISIPDRKTIVIGGFTRDSSTNTRAGIPGLMQIPGVGKLFSKENKRKTASRLYLFVRPKILSAPDFEDLQNASETKKNDIEKLSRKSKIKDEIKTGIGRQETRAEVIEEK